MTTEHIANCYARGNSISLRHPTRDDVELGWTEWFSDPEITQHLPDHYWPNSTEVQTAYYERLLESRDRLALSIVNNADGLLIGTCSLSGINYAHRYASIAVVIGDKRYHRGGIGLEAYDLLLDVAFKRLNLTTVLSFSSSMNDAVQAVHKLVGFARRGIVPAVFDYSGEPADMVVSSISRQEWIQRHRPQRQTPRSPDESARQGDS